MPEIAADFPWVPDTGAQVKTTPRISVIKFGDNYEQRVGLGINRTPKVLPLTFSLRSDTEAQAILNFLETKGGQTPFTFRMYSGQPLRKVVTEGEWTHTIVDYNNNTIAVTFREVP